MSLEEALKANTAAVVALTAVMQAHGTAAPKAPAAPVQPTKEAKPAAAKASPSQPATAPTSTTADAPMTYDALAKKFLDLVAKKGRDEALKVIAPLPALNAIKAGEQEPGQYAALAKKIDAALAPSAEQAPASLV